MLNINRGDVIKISWTNKQRSYIVLSIYQQEKRTIVKLFDIKNSFFCKLTYSENLKENNGEEYYQLELKNDKPMVIKPKIDVIQKQIRINV